MNMKESSMHPGAVQAADRVTYVIAEIGINYNGLLENCYKMIDAAAEAGCNAVKFQFFRAKDLYPRSAGVLDWKDQEKEYSYDIYKAVESFELPEEWVATLITYCRVRTLDVLSSVFDAEGLDFLMQKGLKGIKLASYVVTNLPLIEHCARTGMPIIMSTGGATLAEISEAVDVVRKYHGNLSLLHCSIQYPTPLDCCNLGILKTLQCAFPGIPIGYSDHTAEVSRAPVQAVYLGAQIIEKHITMSKSMDGPDHFFALEPQELKRMVADIRQAEADYRRGNVTIDETLYGSSARIVYPHERYLREFAFMRLFARRNIKKGEIIAANDIAILRPGKKRLGLEPKYFYLFEEHRVTAKKDISFEDPITWDAILE
ncbi:MAG: N-acetylneuraminate synthase family protein [Nitrospirota bacterium]